LLNVKRVLVFASWKKFAPWADFFGCQAQHNSLPVKSERLVCVLMAGMEELEAWLVTNGSLYPKLRFTSSRENYPPLLPPLLSSAQLTHSRFVAPHSVGPAFGGRGAFATGELLPGEEMCSLPLAMVLTTEVARKSEVGHLVLSHLTEQG